MNQRRAPRIFYAVAASLLLLLVWTHHHHHHDVTVTVTTAWTTIPSITFSSRISHRNLSLQQWPTRSRRIISNDIAAFAIGDSSSEATRSGHQSFTTALSKDKSQIGLNELQTLLREAIAAENYKEAATLRDLIADTLSTSNSNIATNDNENDAAVVVNHQQVLGLDQDTRKYKRLSWVGLGTAPWLVDRLEALNYMLPTTIQIHAFESINEMLFKLQQAQQQGAVYPHVVSYPQQTLEELMQSSAEALASSGEKKRNNMTVIVSGSTGSGKTLAYLVPLLSTLSESLFERQRIRVKAESDVTDAADDLLSRVAIQTSPEVRGKPGQHQINADKAKRVTMSMGKSGRDITSPLALIVVPTRELGVQTAMLLYELVGGSTKRTATEFSGKRNMFKYKGPRGVKIGCILDDQEAESGLTLQTDVAITTPQYLTKLLQDQQIKPEKLRVVVYDEADLALENTKDEDLKVLFKDEKDAQKEDEEEEEEDYLDRRGSNSRLTYLVGASVTDSLQQIPVVREYVLPKDFTYLATSTSFSPVVFDETYADDAKAKSSLSQLRLRLDPGVIHERVVAPNNTGLLCLSRMLRRELREYDEKIQHNETLSKKIASPRVVIFFPNEKEARECMPKLRDAMWGDFKLSVLLPSTGVSPLSVMEDFKLNKTSVMLATPNSVRGLDFLGLTHVYTLYLPANDPREYVHLAGRVGRIGQLGSVTGVGGRVTSILRPEEAEQMENLAKQLGFEFVDAEYAKAEISNVEDMRRYLEDTITLLGEAEEVDLSERKVYESVVDVTDDDEEDDNDEDDDEGDAEPLSARNSGCSI